MSGYELAQINWAEKLAGVIEELLDAYQNDEWDDELYEDAETQLQTYYESIDEDEYK